jgi:hypothetical protein
MQRVRPVFAAHPCRFGRGRLRELAVGAEPAQGLPLSEDLKLFATTFLMGFVFVSVLIA